MTRNTNTTQARRGSESSTDTVRPARNEDSSRLQTPLSGTSSTVTGQGAHTPTSSMMNQSNREEEPEPIYHLPSGILDYFDNEPSTSAGTSASVPVASSSQPQTFSFPYLGPNGEFCFAHNFPSIHSSTAPLAHHPSRDAQIAQIRSLAEGNNTSPQNLAGLSHIASLLDPVTYATHPPGPVPIPPHPDTGIRTPADERLAYLQSIIDQITPMMAPSDTDRIEQLTRRIHRNIEEVINITKDNERICCSIKLIREFGAPALGFLGSEVQSYGPDPREAENRLQSQHFVNVSRINILNREVMGWNQEYLAAAWDTTPSGATPAAPGPAPAGPSGR